jgi:hypothetical protein
VSRQYRGFVEQNRAFHSSAESFCSHDVTRFGPPTPTRHPRHSFLGRPITDNEVPDSYEKEFDGVQDVFELQRNLNNAFAYDLVPSPAVVSAALRAARRVNDFPTAVRIFEGIKAKVENKGQYQEYLDELKPLREELGIPLKEDMYPEESK